MAIRHFRCACLDRGRPGTRVRVPISTLPLMGWGRSIPMQMAEIRNTYYRLHTLFTVDLVDLVSAGAEFREGGPASNALGGAMVEPASSVSVNSPGPCGVFRRRNASRGLIFT